MINLLRLVSAARRYDPCGFVDIAFSATVNDKAEGESPLR